MLITDLTNRIERPPHIGQSGLPRSTNPKVPHVTDIIDRIITDLGMSEKRAGGFDDMPLTAEMGFVWEDALQLAYGKRFTEIERPPEVTRDGIVGSPDGLSRKVKVVQEYKLKWVSVKNFDYAKQMKWQMQAKSYCCLMGQGWRKVRYWVCFVMGDWGYGQDRKVGPEMRVFDVTFMDEELRVHWDMMRKYRDTIVKERNK